MKRYNMLIMLFVLTAALLTGCGCTGPTMDQTEAPTVLPTNEEVRPTTRPPTQPSTEPSTQATTEPAATTAPFDNGNGPMDPGFGTEVPDSTETNRAKMR